ncbi:MAG: transposase [Burkholderiaceae bacterium]|nr:transposase [Burkholderiaceae bacterium]
MRKDEHLRQEPKGKSRVKNWQAVYNAELIARGDVTIWMERDLWQRGVKAETVKRGRRHVYADAVVRMLLGLKQVFRLPLRALQGFMRNMSKLAFADLPVPNYTTLCRRARDLDVMLPPLRSGEALHLLADSTGLKVFGEGEWKVRKHGYCKRRT